MNDVDAWIYFDGPEPERIRPLLDALRDLPPATPEDKERVARRFFEKLDAMLERLKEATPDPPAPAPGLAPPPGGLTGTAPALDISPELQEKMGRLPFRPLQPGEPRATRTLQVPVMPTDLGDTAPLGDDSIAKAVAALPFVMITTAAGLIPIPRLSTDEYARFRAELAIWPERSAEILPKYRVRDEAARAALDAHWQTHLADKPEARARFEGALEAHMGWLRAERR